MKSEGRLLTDADYHPAIQALQESTRAIEQQCRVLEAQKSALLEIQSQNRSSAAVARSHSYQRQPRSTPKARIESEDDHLAETLQQDVSRMEWQCKDAVNAADTSLTRQLDRDDKILDGLERVVREVSTSGGEGELKDEVEKLCKTLVSLRSATWRNHINRVYREALYADRELINGTASHEESFGQDNDTITELSGELDSLMTEIGSVLSMVVDYEYQKPITRVLTISEADANTHRMLWEGYVQETLKHMTDSISLLNSDYQELRAYQEATSTIAAALAQATRVPDRTRPALATNKSSEVSHTGLKPPFLLRAQSFSSPTSPIFEVLRSFDIRLPASSQGDPTKMMLALQRVIAERQSHLNILRTSTQPTISSHLSESLHKAETEVQTLSAALHAYSPFSTINLADPVAMEKLKKLEAKVARAGSLMGNTDTGVLVAAARRRQDTLLA